MSFLKNAWYCAAWTSEITRTPLSRTLLGQKVVMYRKLDGVIAADPAQENRCREPGILIALNEVCGSQSLA